MLPAAKNQPRSAKAETRFWTYKKATLPFVSYALVDGNLVTRQNPGSAKETAKGAVVTPASEWYIYQLALKPLPPSGAIQFMAKVADVQQMAPRKHFIDSPQQDRRLFLNIYVPEGPAPRASLWLFFTRKYDVFDFIHVILFNPPSLPSLGLDAYHIPPM
ncbi:hypothetical protein MAJ_09651, partial [Metarhizium majus ARSEF 297]